MKIKAIQSIEIGFQVVNRQIAIVTFDDDTKRLYYKSSKGTRCPDFQGCWSRFLGIDIDNSLREGKNWFIKCPSPPGGFRLEGKKYSDVYSSFFGFNNDKSGEDTKDDVIFHKAQDIFVVDVLNNNSNVNNSSAGGVKSWETKMKIFSNAVYSNSQITNQKDLPELKRQGIALGVTQNKINDLKNIKSQGGFIRLMQHCVDEEVEIYHSVKTSCENHKSYEKKIIGLAKNIVEHARENNHQRSRAHKKRDIFIQAAQHLNNTVDPALKSTKIKKLITAAKNYRLEPRKFKWMKRKQYSSGYRGLANKFQTTRNRDTREENSLSSHSKKPEEYKAEGGQREDEMGEKKRTERPEKEREETGPRKYTL